MSVWLRGPNAAVRAKEWRQLRRTRSECVDRESNQHAVQRAGRPTRAEPPTDAASATRSRWQVPAHAASSRARLQARDAA